jgi:hypothetical protein
MGRKRKKNLQRENKRSGQWAEQLWLEKETAARVAVVLDQRRDGRLRRDGRVVDVEAEAATVCKKKMSKKL